MVDLLVDNETVAARLVSTAAVVVVAVALAAGLGRLVGRRVDDAYGRYYARKAVRYAVAFVALITLAVLWRAFAGRAGVVLGIAAAGLAFAMQEVVGALAGWVNILSGHIFRVGDRIEMGGVRGDVIDITPLRTKVMEIGSPDGGSWVRGRQFTGRIVAISNKATFTEPVYNFSAGFDFIWEELVLPVPYDHDWRRAEQILQGEVDEITLSSRAKSALEEMARRYPLARADVESRVYARAAESWMELSARFMVPVRTARQVKDELTRKVLTALEAEGIQVASPTQQVTLRFPDDARRPTS